LHQPAEPLAPRRRTLGTDPHRLSPVCLRPDRLLRDPRGLPPACVADRAARPRRLARTALGAGRDLLPAAARHGARACGADRPRTSIRPCALHRCLGSRHCARRLDAGRDRPAEGAVRSGVTQPVTSRRRRWRRWLLAGLGVWLALWLLGISGNTLGRYFGWIVPPDAPQALADLLRPFY